VENNWHILDHRVGDTLDSDQQALVREIFLSLHSPEFRDSAWEQFVWDNRSRDAVSPEQVFGTASIALFANEETEAGEFEFVLTGRHRTLRCESSESPEAAFGGPVFYGHAAGGFYEKPDHPGNVYWFQGERANELFARFEPDQKKRALLEHSRGERGTRTVAWPSGPEDLPGFPIAELDDGQHGTLLELVDDLLLPFRTEDRKDARRRIENQLADTRISYYRQENVGDDEIWDTWLLAGPELVWYFRGDPHVHVWVHVGGTAA